jgi:hypothetical protein
VDEIPRLNLGMVLDTAQLEGSGREWNSRWSGEMRRYREEHLRRKRFSMLFLTLKHES